MFFLMANFTKKLKTIQMLFFASNNALAVFVIGFVMYFEISLCPAPLAGKIIS